LLTANSPIHGVDFGVAVGPAATKTAAWRGGAIPTRAAAILPLKAACL
jgi:hypothetical protein